MPEFVRRSATRGGSRRISAVAQHLVALDECDGSLIDDLDRITPATIPAPCGPDARPPPRSREAERNTDTGNADPPVAPPSAIPATAPAAIPAIVPAAAMPAIVPAAAVPAAVPVAAATIPAATATVPAAAAAVPATAAAMPAPPPPLQLPPPPPRMPAPPPPPCMPPPPRDWATAMLAPNTNAAAARIVTIRFFMRILLPTSTKTKRLGIGSDYNNSSNIALAQYRSPPPTTVGPPLWYPYGLY